MGFTPDKAWADEFLHATFHKLGGLSGQGLANVICALAVMPLHPPPAWLYAYVKVSHPASSYLHWHSNSN